MAGGYHLFSTGEVLTAANVDNYLMNQTVMVFASAAARTSALAGVLAEGMQSYRLDAHINEYYTGSAWAAVPSSAKGNTIVILGDSITSYNGGPSIASPTSFWDSKGWFVWGNILLGGRLRCLNNGGMAGQTSAQIAARITTDAISFNPSWIHIMAGRNDDGVTTGQLTADTISNLTSMYTACYNAGIPVIASTIMPGPTSDTASKIQHDNDVNRWIRDYVRSTPGLYLNDMGETVVDVTTNWRSLAATTVPDRVHPNSPGAALMGKKFAAVMSPLVSPADLLAAGTGTENFLANPYMNGSGTSNPTSWNNTNSPAISYVPRTDNVQGSWVQYVVANGGGYADAHQNVSLTGTLAVGASCYFVAEVQVDTLDPSPAANTQAFDCYVQCYNGSSFTTKAYSSYWDTTYVNCPFPGTSGIYTTSAMIIPSGTTLVQVVIAMHGGGHYRVGRTALRVGNP